MYVGRSGPRGLLTGPRSLRIDFTRAILFDYFRKGAEVGPRRVSAPWLSVGTEGAHRRGDFAPTSGSPVAPSRTCRLFPRRDSRSPHLSSVRVSRYPSTPLGRLSFSLLQLLLPPTFLSLSLSLHLTLYLFPCLFFPSWFYSIPLLSSVSSCSYSVRPSLVNGGTRVHHGPLLRGHAYLFLDIFVRPRDIQPCTQATNFERGAVSPYPLHRPP